MDRPGQMRGTAITLGVIALILIGTGIVIAVIGRNESGSPSTGVLIRSGAILGAVALVLPTIRKPSFSTVLIAGAGLALVLFRPALIWVALPASVGWLLVGRQRKMADKES